MSEEELTHYIRLLRQPTMPDFLDIIKILVLFGGVILISGAASLALKGWKSGSISRSAP